MGSVSVRAPLEAVRDRVPEKQPGPEASGENSMQHRDRVGCGTKNPSLRRCRAPNCVFHSVTVVQACVGQSSPMACDDPTGLCPAKPAKRYNMIEIQGVQNWVHLLILLCFYPVHNPICLLQIQTCSPPGLALSVSPVGCEQRLSKFCPWNTNSQLQNRTVTVPGRPAPRCLPQQKELSSCHLSLWD